MATAKVLVVSGGAAGYHGGGGGAGGVLYEVAHVILAQAYTVTIGTGGALGANDGNPSTFDGISPAGGGCGGGDDPNGNPGGSGGGGRENYGVGGTSYGGAAVPSGQGYAGGGNNGYGSSGYPGGGGGGGGGVGQNAINSNTAGDGGIGIADANVGNLLSMASAPFSDYIAGGGGGGTHNPKGYSAGGLGGGGRGYWHPAESGTPNTGGGGGGARTNTGAGGSGIVIVAYTTADFGGHTGGDATGTDGSLTWVKFTSSGTLTLLAGPEILELPTTLLPESTINTVVHETLEYPTTLTPENLDARDAVPVTLEYPLTLLPENLVTAESIPLIELPLALLPESTINTIIHETLEFPLISLPENNDDKDTTVNLEFPLALQTENVGVSATPKTIEYPLALLPESSLVIEAAPAIELPLALLPENNDDKYSIVDTEFPITATTEHELNTVVHDTPEFPATLETFNVIRTILVDRTIWNLYAYEFYNELILDTTASGAYITEDQADFPVSIEITAATFTEADARTDFFSAANVDGKRIGFFMGDDYATPLDYQLVKYDDSGQIATYKVKVPRIIADNDIDNIVRVGYSADDGNWPQVAQDKPENVWSNNYLAAFLYNPTTDFTDSLGGSAMTNAGTTSVTSRIDSGRGFDGASGLNLAHDPTYALPIGGVSCILKIADTSGGKAVIAEKLNDNPATGDDSSATLGGWQLAVNTAGKVVWYVRNDSDETEIIGDSVIDDGTNERFVAGTHDGEYLRVYVADSEDATPVASTIVPYETIEKLCIGYDIESAGLYLPNGAILDELRFHAIPRSADWMVLEDWSTRRSAYVADAWIGYSNQKEVPEEPIQAYAETVVVKDGIIVAIQNAAPEIYGEYIKDGTLSIAKLAEEVTAFIIAEGKKIEIVQDLPALPDSLYPDGTFVALASENYKLYRSLGEEWTAAIEATQITGSIVTGQIAADAIVAQLLAADSVVAGKIAAGAIQAGALQADSVKADNISTNAITTIKLIAEAVTAIKIATGAITTDKLDAESVTTNKLAAESVVAGKIAANAIVADDGVIGSLAVSDAQIADLTANKLTAGTIDADDIAITGQNNKTNINSDGIRVEKVDDSDVAVVMDANDPQGRILRVINGALSIEDENGKTILDAVGMVADGIISGVMPGTNNPIKNSSFEKIDDNSRPIDWTRSGPGADNIDSDTDFKFGTKCFRCNNGVATYAKASQDVVVKSQTDYTLSFYYKCTALGILAKFGDGTEYGDNTEYGEGTEIGTQGAVVRVYDEAGAVLLAESPIIIGTESSWTREIMPLFNSGSDAVVKVEIWIGDSDNELSGELLLDAIMISEGAVIQPWSLSIYDWLNHVGDEDIHGDNAPVGAIFEWPTYIPPSGYLILDGSTKSRATYSDLFEILVPNLGEFYVTIATPAIISLTNEYLQIGDSFYVTTTGTLPTGMTENTLYYIISAGFGDHETFQFSATRGGAAINTSGTQSGTHTFYHCPFGLGDGNTTFDLPDHRKRVAVGHDNTDSDFGYMGAVGGAKTHVLTQTELPNISVGTGSAHNHGNTNATSHNHGQNSHNHSQSSHTHTISTSKTAANGTGQTVVSGSGTSRTTNGRTAVNIAATASNITESAHVHGTNDESSHIHSLGGSDTAHNNQQLFTTVNKIIKT